VAYFILSAIEAAPEDVAWIEDLRSAHDPHHGLVAPHATLVFGFERPSLATVADHVDEVARRFAPIVCRLTSARAQRDLAGAGSHLFLIPNSGAAEITALHDALYDGPLRGDLRTDIAFVPHVTVGRFDEPSAAEALARRLTDQVDVAARLSRLDLVAFDGGPVAPVASWTLAGDWPAS